MIRLIAIVLTVVLCASSAYAGRDRVPPAFPGGYATMQLTAQCTPLASAIMGEGSDVDWSGIDLEGDMWFVAANPDTRRWSIWFTVDDWVCWIARGDMYGPHLKPKIPTAPPKGLKG